MRIHILSLTALGVALAAAPLPVTNAPAPAVQPNSNTARAGTLRDGVLTLDLEAKESLWRFSRYRPPLAVEAFSEAGKAPVMPGPFVRVPAGTQLRITVRNSLSLPLTFLAPAALHGGPDRVDAMDTIVVRPGTVDTLITRADVAGNYVYRGTIPDGVSKVSHIAGALVGAIVVDSAATPTPPTDRVLVIIATEDSASRACDDTTTVNPLSECRGRRFLYTLNGTQWPNTERVHATVGDSLHWRVINASAQVHPMHLHGFYFRVDALTGPLADTRPAPGQLVVTQLLDALSSMSMTWSPTRPGNWLFHCHFALHNSSYAMMATPDDPEMRDMVGLVIGAIVSPRPGVVVAGHTRPAPLRHLRLIAEALGARKPNGPDTLPAMHFVLDGHGQRVDTHTDVSPELDLRRGEPVAITIVNHLDESTSVHWHGIEVEDSYMDGAAGFSGEGKRLAPAIAPGDSFTARFTPTRSGTFMYHAHMDEMRQELAGLTGMLVVRDSASASPNDYALLFKGDGNNGAHPFAINGQRDPDTLVLHVGQRARFRLGNLSKGTSTAAPSYWLTARPDSAARIANDTMLVRWQPVAKDGFDLPASARSLQAAQHVVSVGETFDFEYTPVAPGNLRLELRTPRPPHALLIRVPIRVVGNAVGGAMVRPDDSQLAGRATHGHVAVH